MGKNVFKVPDGVKTVKRHDYEQWGYQGEETIVLPDSVTELGPNAFLGCKTLKNITIPGSVKVIGGEAFANCVNLENVVISQGVKEIRGGAFAYCRNLKSIEIPDSVEKMLGCFTHCEKLEYVRLSPDIEKLPRYIFEDCKSLKSVDISHISELEEGVFINSGLESIVLPDDISVIPARAFSGCKNLKQIDLSGITVIEKMAFQASGLESVVLSDEIKEISYGAFSYSCLKDVKVGKAELGEEVFSDCKNLRSVCIDSEEIPSFTFLDCTALEEVHFGSNTREIKTKAFVSCKALEDVTFEALAVKDIRKKDRILQQQAFIDCDINRLVIPGEVRMLTEWTFVGCKINKLTLPDTMVSIGNQTCSVKEELNITDTGAGLDREMIRQLVVYGKFDLSIDILNRIRDGVKTASIESSLFPANGACVISQKIELSNTSYFKNSYKSPRKYETGFYFDDYGTITYDFIHKNGCFEGSMGMNLSIGESSEYSLQSLIGCMKGYYQGSDKEFEDIKKKVTMWNTNKTFPFEIENEVFGLYIRSAGEACLYMV